MKKYFLYTFLFSAALIASAAAAYKFSPDKDAAAAENSGISSESNSKETETKSREISECFLVLDSETDCVLQVSAIDYVIGAVAAEMPAGFEEEALKAQAAAAYTYALRMKEINGSDSALHGAAFSDDSTKYQAFYTNEEIKEIYGSDYEKNYEKIKNAVSEVYGYYIAYENEPIIAAFHSMSCGKTESAANVWGSDVPYLVSVESKSDKDAPNYETKKTMTKKEVNNIISELCGAEKSEERDPGEWIAIEKKSEIGTVISVRICGREYSGDEIRAAFGLRSSNFSIAYNKEKEEFTFTVYGYGHGVGMSQYGANSMAKNGADWKEIVEFYYKGAKVQRIY